MIFPIKLTVLCDVGYLHPVLKLIRRRQEEYVLYYELGVSALARTENITARDG